ncbi:hypothetical protein PX699_29245 [Sphingobium sp. H39-3-25]|uniref:hypothetical protein n=1 Tax=Sphingobium arseniciresistens TaxID=3030834 RepID=UPI0023B8F8D0|nr:hypothetical protein [Sphingobium arseniciresistens]
MKRMSGLDDPQIAATAWGRYRRMMTAMALGGIACVLLVLGILWWRGSPLPIHMIVATSIGVWCTFMLGTGLMALAFLSSGTGHDESIDDRVSREIDLDE